MITNATQQQQVAVSSGVRAACLTAFVIGATIVGLVGFAQSSTLHNAAHDSRHALAFPCH